MPIECLIFIDFFGYWWLSTLSLDINMDVSNTSTCMRVTYMYVSLMYGTMIKITTYMYINDGSKFK